MTLLLIAILFPQIFTFMGWLFVAGGILIILKYLGMLALFLLCGVLLLAIKTINLVAILIYKIFKVTGYELKSTILLWTKFVELVFKVTGYELKSTILLWTKFVELVFKVTAQSLLWKKLPSIFLFLKNIIIAPIFSFYFSPYINLFHLMCASVFKGLLSFALSLVLFCFIGFCILLPLAIYNISINDYPQAIGMFVGYALFALSLRFVLRFFKHSQTSSQTLLQDKFNAKYF